jgi:hypothetical protein
MRLFAWRQSVVATLVFVACSSTASAQSVAFKSLRDAVPDKFFNAAASAPDPANPNKLVIRFNTGLDFRTLTYNDFRASTAAFNVRSAMDTLSFDVVVPSTCVGCYVASITYTQKGAGSVLRSGAAYGASNWIVAGVPSQLGFFGANPTLTRTADVRALRLRTVPVVITTSLFAWAPPALGSASTTVSYAEVVVVIARP